MKISDVMTKTPVSCEASTPVEEVAKIMLKCDCGAVPVIEGERVIGMITDRDIVLRSVAAGRCPLEMTAVDLMSRPVAVIGQEETLDFALKFMEENQIRRAPVVDNSGALAGLITQADIARQAPLLQVGELVKSISQVMDLGHA